MATSSIPESVIPLLHRTHPSLDITASSDAVKASAAIYSVEYSEAEKAELKQWLITSSHIGSPAEDAAKTAERLSSLNTHLSSRTTVLGSKPSVADVALFKALAPVVKGWNAEQRTGEQGYHHIVRFVDFVQNADRYGPLKLDEADKVAIDADEVVFKLKPVDAKAEKERKKKEKEAASAAASGAATPVASEAKGQKSVVEKAKETVAQAGETVAAAVTGEQQQGKKKEKKPKQPKPQKEAPKEKQLSPCLIDLRVGHILKAINHPNADSLYVSTIACGDAPGTDNTSEHEGQVVRTVCSGLNGLVPLEEMQGRKVVVVCNLKPVTMRGIKSCAMVLAASPRVADGEEDSHKGPVELVNPPADSKAGDRVYFDGWQGEPEAVLNPKKKIWETLQPGFTTTDDREVAFEVAAVPQLAAAGEGEEKKAALGMLRTAAGVCTVKTLKGATVR